MVGQRLTEEDYQNLKNTKGHKWICDQPLPKNAHTKTRWIAACGHEMYISYTAISSVSTCPSCGFSKRNDHKRLKIDDYRSMKEINGHEWIESNPLPKGNAEKTWWIAPCGHEIFTSYSKVKSGCSCRFCRNRMVHEKLRFNESDYKSAEIKYGFKWIDGQSVPKNAHEKTWWIAPCDHKAFFSYAALKRKKTCRSCGHKETGNKLRLDRCFYESMKGRKGFEWIEGQPTPINNQEKTWWIAPCGHKVFMSHGGISSGRGCSICNESHGEREIAIAFSAWGIEFARQQKALGCKYKGHLKYDFYIPDLKTFIEYHGIHHYEPVDFAGKGVAWATKMFTENQLRDQIKTKWARDNGYRLIVIPYWIVDIENFLFCALSVQLDLIS